MNGPTKLALWTGAIIALLGSGLPNQILYSIGWATTRIEPNHDVVAFGLCCVVGALAYWRGYDSGRRDERHEWNESRNKDKNSN
jgi:hypothetical protein